MDHIVSPYQFGFIRNRNIHENVVVAQEILNSMHYSKRKVGSFIINVDLAKAYDNIN